jgi:predicted nucleotidyltransferase
MIDQMSRESSMAAVERFRRSCAGDPLVIAAFLGGSHAAGTARPDSDIDLYVVTRPEDYAAFVERRQEFLLSWSEPTETEGRLGLRGPRLRHDDVRAGGRRLRRGRIRDDR